MVEKSASGKGKYLYAIVLDEKGRSFQSKGINDADIHFVSDGRVAAVVSDYSEAGIRPERRHLAAHHDVIKHLMTETTPLPISFGIIARGGAKAVKKILGQNRAAFQEQLDRVSGKVEMGLKVVWDVPNIFEYFVNVHEELRMARDQLLVGRREPSQEDKIEIGRMFDRILQEDRETHARDVEEALSLYCYEIRRNTPRTEREVVDLACLVGRNSQVEFEKGIFEAARLFNNHFAFDYNGPWAPHHFVNIDLKL